MPGAYYNEIDPFAAAWLRELIKAGHIADGVVDERSIEDVSPDDIRPFTQCHFFAGICVWSHALRRAGWPDDHPIWTGSCPCQPFSAAGKGGGFEDERHLWPAWDWLIEQCDPPVIIGEQVASKDAEPWLDLVQADLEDMGYAFGAVAFPSAGVGAPHIRDRTYWVADAADARRQRGRAGEARDGSGTTRIEPERLRDAERLAHHHHHQRLEGDNAGRWVAQGYEGHDLERGGAAGGLAEPDDTERRADTAGRDDGHGADPGRTQVTGDVEGRYEFGDPGSVNGLWREADWLFCRDGKWRPVEPGTFPLAHGAPARVGRLRGYGNAINAQAAQVFIESYLDACA